MMSLKSLVSIIIVNWNGGEVFKDCLKSLAKIHYPNWELIVVDNGSADNSQYLPEKIKLHYKSFKLIKNSTNLGFAPANNQGYKVSKGKYLLLLNNDTKVVPDLLNVLIERMEKEEKVAVVQPKILLMDKLGYLDNAGSFLTRIGFLDHWGFMQKDSKEFGKEREVFSTKGACMMIRKAVVDKIGLFDPDFFSYFEESDFCWRIWLCGFKVLYYPKTKIYHKLGYTIKRLDVLNLNYHYNKNRIRSLLKNLEPKNLILVLIPHLAIWLGIMLIFLLRLQYKNAWMVVLSFWWNLAHLSETLAKRKVVQNFRTVSDDYLFWNLSKPIDWGKYFGDFKRVESDIKLKSSKNLQVKKGKVSFDQSHSRRSKSSQLEESLTLRTLRYHQPKN